MGGGIGECEPMASDQMGAPPSVFNSRLSQNNSLLDINSITYVFDHRYLHSAVALIG